MYVINPAPASQDLQPTASSYVAAHHPASPESIELEQQHQQHKEILSQILTKCNADMSEQVANFSCPDAKKTPPPPRSTVAAAAPVKQEPNASPVAAVPPASSPCSEGEGGHGVTETSSSVAALPLKEESSSSTPVGGGDGKAARRTDGEIRSPLPTHKPRSASPDGSPLSTASSSNAASLSPASLDGTASSTAKPSPPKSEPLAETIHTSLVASPVSNFSSVVHPKERALKSIAAAAASNERNNVPNDGGSSSASVKPSTKVAGTAPGAGRPALNGTGSGTAHGGRLQFFKDGKFILELARAREGEKTSWISVPRKTFWPPTVSSTSASFHKHESSTSLSFSDDNSSIQSSPWQRDHCWKQANPRRNISKELSLYYFCPRKAHCRLSLGTRSWWRRKRRRPYDSNLPPEFKSTSQSKAPLAENGNVKKEETVKEEVEPQVSTEGDGSDETIEGRSEKCNGTTPMDTSEVAPAASDEKGKNRKGSKQNGPSVEADHERSNGHHPSAANGGPHFKASRGKRLAGKDLASIIHALVELQQTRSLSSLANPSTGAGSAVGPFRLGTIAERGNGSGTSFRSSVFASTAASQHVSPRKRILRELEKVSLEDGGSGGTSSTKRSRPKSGSAVGTPVIVTATTATPLTTLTTNGTGNSLNGGSSSGNSSSSSSSSSNSKANGHVNGTVGNGSGKQQMNGAGSATTNPAPVPAPAPVSRPFSSYSITSLLGHSASTSSSSSGETATSASGKGDVSVASVTSTASHHLYHHQQHPLSPHHQYQGSPYLGKEPLSVGSKSPVMTDPIHHAHYQGQLGSSRYGYGAKKRSPSYGGGNGTAASPGAVSGGSNADPYGGSIRSPDLSPSPEHHHHQQQQQQQQQQQPHAHLPSAHHGLHHTPGSVSSSGFSRYRQHPYGGSPCSYSSAPSSSRFSPSPSTNDSATTPPYSGAAASGGARAAIPYRPGYQMGGGGSSQGHSPPTSNGSPQHYSRVSPLNFGRGAPHSPPPPPVGSQHQHQHSRSAGGTSSSSPRASPSGGVTTSHATTPTSAMASLTTSASPSPSIRTVPKKTAALRQPFSGGHSPSSASPSRERSNSNASSSSHKKDSQPEGADTVDGPTLNHYGAATPSSPAGVIRPNTVIASPTAHHPVPPNAFYPLYQAAPLGASSSSPAMSAVAAAAAAAAAASSVPFHPVSLSYYQQMYTAATMAAYRTPLWMHYPGLPAVAAPHGPHMVQPPHPQHPPPSAIPPSSDRRHIDRRSPPSPPPSAVSAASIMDATESQRLQQHSILASQPPSSTAALNYSVTALSSSSRDIINGGSAFSSPSGSSWPTDAVGYQHHPDHSARSTVSAIAKDEPSNDVPLNLSKH